jgi:hypothetical protein
MALADTAIVAYAETKIVQKTDRDVWELGAEVLEALLDKTGMEKREIDGLVLSGSQTGAGNPFWSQAKRGWQDRHDDASGPNCRSARSGQLAHGRVGGRPRDNAHAGGVRRHRARRQHR